MLFSQFRSKLRRSRIADPIRVISPSGVNDLVWSRPVRYSKMRTPEASRSS